MIAQEKKYWNREWERRIEGNSVNGNAAKFRKIMNFMLERPYLWKKRKLDIGCGPAHLALNLSSMLKEFGETWTGIDISEVGINFASSKGLNTILGDFLNMEGNNYEVFFLWDSLEHFQDHLIVAQKISELGADHYYVCGNVPLFHQELIEGTEKPMNIEIIKEFLSHCGCTKYWYEVYDTSGWPFLMFEGMK